MDVRKIQMRDDNRTTHRQSGTQSENSCLNGGLGESFTPLRKTEVLFRTTHKIATGITALELSEKQQKAERRKLKKSIEDHNDGTRYEIKTTESGYEEKKSVMKTT